MMHWTREIRKEAYVVLKAAIRRGDVPPIDGEMRCSDCDQAADFYDHRNYFRPLDVDPICKPCNNRRGQGLPHLKGVSENNNGLDFQIRGLSFSGRSDIKVGKKSADVRTRLSESDAVAISRAKGMPQHRVNALNELNSHNYKYTPMARGDLRCEYFKKHDPYYICEEII